MYMFWNFIETLYIEIKHKYCKNCLRTKETLQKLYSFFFRELELITVLLLIINFYMSRRFVSLKAGVVLSNFWFRFVFIKVYIFAQQNARTLWIYVIIPFKIKIIENPHTILLQDPWFFKMQNKVLKLNDIFVSWSSPKTCMETNFLCLENRSFENVTFSQ